MKKLLTRLALGLALAVTAVIAAAVIYLYATYGGGRPYEDLSAAPLLGADALETVVTSQEPIGNAAVSLDGRVFYTIHPQSGPTGPKLYEWKDGKPVPFPAPEEQTRRFATPLGLAVDAKNRLWVIDPGEHGTQGARLIAIDVASGRVVKDHPLSSDIAPLGSFLQDLRTDPAAEVAYIADVSFWRRSPGIVIVDLESGAARRVLDGHPSVVSQNILIRTPIKDMSFFGGILALKTGIDGIAVDPSGTWVYWAAMNHTNLYRARTADLKNARLSAGELSARVEDMGRKPLSDGISTDVAGGVLITDIEHGAVLRRTPQGKLETLVRDKRIRWADAVSYGSDGFVYLADSAIPHQMLMSKAHMAAHAPYHVFRFKPADRGVAGQ